jgi:small nuclear ribonucleoprotein (snRNP)-like protein
VDEKNSFLDSLLNKKVRIVQKDGFVKSGILSGYDKEFIFLIFSNKDKVAIRRDGIMEISEYE